MHAATILVLLLAAVPPDQAPPQPPAATDPTPPRSEQIRTQAPPRFDLRFGYERRRDRFRYRFEHQSTFSDDTLVPALVEQRYVADNHWATLTGRYRVVPGRRLVLELGVTPSIDTFGGDLDTFFNPDGNVIVSGTSGRVDMRSIRIGGRLERSLAGDGFQRIGYRWRRDRSIFHVPQPKIVSMTRPPSVVHSLTFNHETTVSQAHEFFVGWTRFRSLGRKWRLTGDLDVAPTVLARLAISLPEKFPGETIVWWTGGYDISGRLTVERSGRLPLALSIDMARSGNYRPAGRFIRDALGVGVAVGF